MLMSLKYQFPNDSISYNIEMFGELVIQSEPVPPEPPWHPEGGPYYVSWSPESLHITGRIDGSYYNNLSGWDSYGNRIYHYDDNGYISFSSSSVGPLFFEYYIPPGGDGLSAVRVSYIETNAYYVDLGHKGVTTSLQTFSAINCQKINDFQFWGESRLANVYIPNCKEIGERAFANCSVLTILSAPAVKSVSSRAFAALTPAYDDILTNAYLQKAYLPNCEYIGNQAFFGCRLISLDLPNCEVIWGEAFKYNVLLQYADLPKVRSMGFSVFEYCNNLRSVHLGSYLSRMPYFGFFGCNSLSCIRLDYSSVVDLPDAECTHFGSIFEAVRGGIPGISAAIYVPSSLVSAYQTWSSRYMAFPQSSSYYGWYWYSSVIRPIPS